MSAIASAFCVLCFENASNISSILLELLKYLSSTVQSSKPQFIPWPWNGTMAWAASPITNVLAPTCQPEHLTVPKDPVGLFLKSSIRLGINGTVSGNWVWKKFKIPRSEVNDSKLLEPAWGRKSVTVKL